LECPFFFFKDMFSAFLGAFRPGHEVSPPGFLTGDFHTPLSPHNGFFFSTFLASRERHLFHRESDPFPAHLVTPPPPLLCE